MVSCWACVCRGAWDCLREGASGETQESGTEARSCLSVSEECVSCGGVRRTTGLVRPTSSAGHAEGTRDAARREAKRGAEPDGRPDDRRDESRD